MSRQYVPYIDCVKCGAHSEQIAYTKYTNLKGIITSTNINHEYLYTCNSTDMSNYEYLEVFQSIGLRDYESRLYIMRSLGYILYRLVNVMIPSV